MNSILFETAFIKGIQIRNRFVRSATNEGMATSDCGPSQSLKDLYFKLAEGGVGLIVTGGASIEGKPYRERPNVQGQTYMLAIDKDRYIKAWKPIVDGVHKRGAKIAMQIAQAGRNESPEMRGSAPIAPSAVPVIKSGIVPREMTVGEIEEMVEGFAQSCRRVKEAGFDGVQIHAGHGYLISNFISPYANVRRDEYGGSPKNRARIIVDITKRVKELIASEFLLMIKMNCDDFIEGGLTKDDAIRIAKIIVQEGIDCIEVTGGNHFDNPSRVSVPGIKKEEQEAYFRSYAQALKKHVSVPLILVGGLRTPDVMDRLVVDDVTDFVSMCRPLIREPELIKRWQDGNLAKAKCISCNKCRKYLFAHPLRCYVESPIKEDQ